MNSIEIKEIGRVVSGSTPKKNREEYWGGDIPWASLKDVSGLKGKFLNSTLVKITEQGYNSCSTQILPKGTVLVSSRAPIGHMAIANVEVCTNQGFKSIVPFDGIDSNYLYYALKFGKRRLIGLGRGATFKEISKKIIEGFKIPFPDTLDDQKRIAKILSDCEALILKRKDSIDLLDELLKSSFMQRFGDIRINSMNLKEDELGNLYPKGILVDGPFGSAINVKEDYTEDGTVPIIRTKNIKRFEFSELDLKFIREKKYEQIKRSGVLPGDILISKVGTIGNVCQFPDTFEKGVLSTTGSSRIRNERDDILNEYLLFYLDMYKELMISRASEGVLKFLTLGHIRKFKILIPEIEEQQEFRRVVEKVNEIKSKYIDNLKELENLYGSISQKVFKDELDLSKVDISKMGDKEQEKPEKEPVGEPRWEGKVQVQDYKVSLDEIIKKDFKEIKFSFEQLKRAVADRAVHVPYESIKSFVFESLEGEEALLEQLFDEDKKKVVFKIK